MRTARNLLRAVLAGLGLLGATQAWATQSQPVASERARASLVADAAAVAPGAPFRLGLRLQMAPGWHTYWRNPGDAGAPAELTLHLPEGAVAGPIAWPLPTRIPEGPLVVFGYKTEVLLPVAVTPPAGLAPGQTFRIEAEATWLVCERICVPEEGRFSLDLPVGPAPVPGAETAPLFVANEALLPREGVLTAMAGFEGPRGALRIEGAALTPASVREALFFPHAEGVLDNTAPQPLALAEGSLVLGLSAGRAALPARLEGVLVVADQRGTRAAFEVAAPLGAVPAGAPEPAPARPAIGLWQAMLFAALGGLILNLMPCVFPILAMKAFGLARLSGALRTEVRAHAASYVLGVLASFAALGGLLLGLRAGGGMAGWGFQFGHPLFVAAMAWLMLLVGLNLSGVYGFGRPVGAGEGLAARGGHAGSFATGALAVLVATPCTAPFMAVALGAALAMPAAQAMAVFMALGLGFAAPYGLLAAFPGAARLLPRPGAWMERARQALAFPMYGAAVWLAWVLAQQAGADGVLLVLAGGLLLAFAAWLLGQGQRAGRRWPVLAAAVPALGAALLLARIDAAPEPATARAEAGAEAWSAARVAALQAEGRAVFVNATAAWCITCKVNEQVALYRAAVQAEFARRDIAYLKADWTRGDPAIGALLRAHGREGVPLYLLYPAGGGPAQVLPEILTEGIVLQALGSTRLAAR